MVIGIEDFHRPVGHDVPRGDRPFPGGIDPNGPRSVLMKLQAHALQVQNDIGHVFLDPGDRGELMENPVKFYGKNGCPLDGGEQDPPECISQGCAETAFQRLTTEFPIKSGMGRFIDIDSFRLNQTAPVSLHNSFPCPSDTW